ncbi:MAG: 3-methylornithyl-N6-L-lysine dehydrogenase PylD [Methanohalobium sp.]|uniref:3-methylornithyl-N6-L-lysine dehydrogenase PylD n=1 Tax=Methanohalobium sp. TaxID=2837493 RepID=UPI00397861B5
MALLTPNELYNVSQEFEKNNNIVKRATGLSIEDICESVYNTKLGSEKIGIIPITAGNGIIGNFAESLFTITNYLELDGFITEHTDVAGYYEAIKQYADILLMADDYLFIAHNLKNGKIATNHVCTGVIYAEIASRCNYADTKDILVIGLGKVGYAGASHLIKKGFNVYAYDPDKMALEKAVSELGVRPYDIYNNGKRFCMVFEATPNENTITEDMISERCLVSTPGIPCGLNPELGKNYDVDLVMEPLLIGVTSMLYSVV